MNKTINCVLAAFFLSLLMAIQIACPAQDFSLLARYSRTAQVAGESDSSMSLTSLYSTARGAAYSDSLRMLYTGKIKCGVFPIRLVQLINTHHPYGWNDGSMIPAKGYQTQFSAGISLSAGPVNLQLRPEFVYATNTEYEHSAIYGTGPNSAYTKLFAGQSSLSVTACNVSIGISTENLWWGPGVRSSLLMSNNAPGFFHGFIRSNKPIMTGIGNFEWNLIGGRLVSDRERTFENYNLSGGPPDPGVRYLNAFVLSYNPKWIPGIFFGMTRGIQTSTGDVGIGSGSLLNKYLPVLFKPFQKQNVLGDDSLNTDQLASFFLRWVFLKAQAEFYIEYGFNDYGFNARDYLMSPTHSAAYITGIRKVIPKTRDRKIEFGIELTRMSQSPDWLVREAGNWYVHSKILEGYTNHNQIIGAGAGLGSNVISIDAAWINGSRRLGFLLEQVNRDPQYHSARWIDLGLGFLPQWKHDQFIFSGLFEMIKTNNYMWQAGETRYNVHAQLSIQYYIK